MIRTILPVLAMAASVTPAFAATTILPGYWESTSKTVLLIESAPKVDHRCITLAQVNDYLSGPSTRHYTCTYSSKSLSGGVANFKGQCRDKRGRTLDVTIHGAYAPESFHMEAQFSLPNLPIGGSASTDAHRISETCPAE